MFDEYLKEQLGFRKNKSTKCLYIKRKERSFVILGLYVDDMTLIGNKDLIETTRNQLEKRFKITKSNGNISKCIGIELGGKNAKTLHLHRITYANEILIKCGMENSKPVSTPMNEGQKLTKLMSPVTDEERKEVAQKHPGIDYRQIVGSLSLLLIR